MARRIITEIDIALDKDRGKYILTVNRGDALLLGYVLKLHPLQVRNELISSRFREPAINNFSKKPSSVNRLVEHLLRQIKKRLKQRSAQQSQVRKITC